MTGGPVDVLVVGAGPTGLALALQAHDHGARVLVVERRSSAFRPSRAMVMHPRTLELLRPRGVTGALLEQGDPAASFQLHLGPRTVRVDAADLDLPGTGFPHLLLIRQAAVEAVLARALDDRGVAVHREWELTGLDGRERRARLTRAGARRQVAFRYLAGCDGIDSTVRRLAGIGWRGGRYREEVVLADVELSCELPSAAAHVFAGRAGMLFLFTPGELAGWRMLATRPAVRQALAPGTFGVPAAQLQAMLGAAGVPGRITEVVWSAAIRPEHRLASRYRRGRLFLAGDAAHCHSPAAAQGMNTGIQDALNLGWKLAMAAQSGGASDSLLLGSYEIERRPVARQVLGLTHAVFWAEASAAPAARFLRGVLAPLGTPVLARLPGRHRVLAGGMRQLSQLRVQYRHSPLSVEGVACGRAPRAGDRLPDETVTVGGRPVGLHELASPPGIHLLLQRDAPLTPGIASLAPVWAGQRLQVHRVSSWAGAGALLVRPDGYLGLRSATADPAAIERWLSLLVS